MVTLPVYSQTSDTYTDEQGTNCVTSSLVQLSLNRTSTPPVEWVVSLKGLTVTLVDNGVFSGLSCQCLVKPTELLNYRTPLQSKRVPVELRLR